MSARSVPGLEVWFDPGDRSFETLLPSTSRYRVVRTVIDRGLLIFETSRGWQALLTLAREIISALKERGEPCLYSYPDFDRLDQYIREFLVRMRRNCPPVYLRGLEGEAATIRWDWAGPQSTLEDFDPQQAGRLDLDHGIILFMAASQNIEEYNIYMFQMAISVAHEICHFLTGYLTGRATPRTPPSIRIPGSKGEAGVYWEVLALGGIVDFFSSPEDPRNVNQAGIPYLFPDGNSDSQASRVSARYIQQFVTGGNGFSLPIQISSSGEPSQTRGQLRRVSFEMAVLRRHARAGRTIMTSSASQSSSSRNRALMQEEYYEEGYPGQPPETR